MSKHDPNDVNATSSRRGFLQVAGTGLAAAGLGYMGVSRPRAWASSPPVLHEPDALTWWIPCDSHVGFSREDDPGEHLRTAIADVNEMEDVDYAVMLGDLVEDEYHLAEPFMRDMNRLKVRWTYTLGNHDFDRDSQKAVLPVHYSGRTVYGIRCIFLSTETANAVNRDLVMNQEQERWFWRELTAHRDKPIFMFTHQPHPEFDKWDELREVLDDYNIVAWFSGHKHRWQIAEDSGHGFVQVNMHSIGGVREDDLSSFLWMRPENGRVDVRVRFRNHAKREWIEANDGQSELTFSVDVT